jgi:hypothetical protein
MRFQVEQRFTAPVADVLDAYTDPAFYERLVGLPKVGEPRVLDRTVDGNRVVLRVHYTFTASLPAAALAVMDADKLTWVEETTFDLAAASSRSRLLPDHYPDRLQASASASFAAAPGDPGATLRRIDGDLKVRMPLVGGKVEGAIVSGLREHLADEADVANRFLAELLG